MTDPNAHNRMLTPQELEDAMKAEGAAFVAALALEHFAQFLLSPLAGCAGALHAGVGLAAAMGVERSALLGIVAAAFDKFAARAPRGVAFAPGMGGLEVVKVESFEEAQAVIAGLAQNLNTPKNERN